MTALKLDPHNARKHDKRNKQMIADSLREFGALRPIIIGVDDVVYAGNATYEQAVAQGIPIEIMETDGTKLYAIRAEHLDEQQLREYGLLDNRATELGSWDTDELRVRLESGDDLESLWSGEELSRLLYPDDYLQNEDDERLRHVEFDADDNDDEYENPYSDKLGTLIYEPTGEQPAIATLASMTKRDELVSRIHAASIDDPKVREFLIVAAQRHVVFDFAKIANYYAHADPIVQELMEESALVIIDTDRAIELGYLKIKQKIDELADEALAIRDGVDGDV